MIAAQVTRGAAVLVGARLATRALDLAAMLVVARLLLPADFGLVALAGSVLLVITAASDFSLSTALIQMRDAPRSAYDTAFTLNFLRGVVLAGILAAAAAPFAALYADPRLEGLMLALALAPLARGLISPRLAARQRELDFVAPAAVEIAGKVAAFVASVAVALATRSAWALIAGMIATPAVATVVSYALVPYRPRFSLEFTRRIFAFSGWLTLSQAVNQLNWQVDRILIGYRLGTATLGQYAVGSELASLPTQAPVQPMMQALFAGFARIGHDRPRLCAAYLASQRTVMALALPIGCAVSPLATPIVTLAIGPGWDAAALVIAVLAPVFALQMLTGPAQAAAMAAGETRTILVRDLIGLALRVPLIVAGLLAFGLVGAVVARVVSGLALVALNLAVMRRIAGASLAAQLVAPWRSLVSAAAMSALMWAAVPHAPTAPVELAAFVVVAAGVGWLVYLALHLALWTLAGRPDGPERHLARLAGLLHGGRRGEAHG